MEDKTNHTSEGILSLVLAILSIGGFIIFGLFSIIFAICAIVLGIIARRKGDKYGTYGLILGILFFLIIILIAAIVYLNLPPPYPPSTPAVALIGLNIDRNCTITITSFTQDNIKWSDCSYRLNDYNSTLSITNSSIGSETTAVITLPTTTYISEGQKIIITCIPPYNATWPLIENHQYRFILVYEVTNGIMGYTSWT